LGAIVDVEACQKDPLGAWMSNVKESVDLARAITVERSFVYMNTVASLMPEENVYGQVKRQAHWILSRMNLPNFASIIMPNCYGVQGSGVLSKFLFSKEPAVFGTGRQVREFLYIDDVVEKLIDIALKPEPGEHILGGQRATINEVAKLVGRKGLRHLPSRPFELDKSPLLNPTWQGKTTLAEGIAKMRKEAEDAGMTTYGGKQ
jgi:nucleoside-diphosphate-sugar epimerase